MSKQEPIPFGELAGVAISDSVPIPGTDLFSVEVLLLPDYGGDERADEYYQSRNRAL